MVPCPGVVCWIDTPGSWRTASTTDPAFCSITSWLVTIDVLRRSSSIDGVPRTTISVTSTGSTAWAGTSCASTGLLGSTIEQRAMAPSKPSGSGRSMRLTDSERAPRPSRRLRLSPPRAAVRSSEEREARSVGFPNLRIVTNDPLILRNQRATDHRFPARVDLQASAFRALVRYGHAAVNVRGIPTFHGLHPERTVLLCRTIAAPFPLWRFGNLALWRGALRGSGSIVGTRPL